MIQIIGFLICACLAVKLLEMAGNSSLRNEDGTTRTVIDVAMWVGWIAVVAFPIWLLAQGDAFPDQPQATGDVGEQLACIDRAETAEEVIACSR